ncbi:hypothetical protein DFH09DRAFT_1362206 [Mycena vulgaris]|nr:hypothetical protein DFH09DRAFT_1362206 [Mycena vulgaris]
MFRVSALAAPSRPTRSPLPSPRRPTASTTALRLSRYRDDATPTPGALSLHGRRDALLAVAPELSGMPAEFIRHCMRAKAPQMLAGIAALRLRRAQRPPARAPGRGPGLVPTHALAIAAAAKGKGGEERDAAPAIFLLLRLPPCAPAGSSRTASATLAVLLLTLPSPHDFAILHAFMYIHRLAPALAALLPLPPAFISSASSHGRSGEELIYAVLLATLSSLTALHALAAHLQPQRAQAT